MGNHDSGEGDETVDASMDDVDDESQAVKTYECNNCGHRVEAKHQPGKCPVCGGEMVDISVSRE